MPFVIFDDVAPLLHPSVRLVLTAPDVFEAIERQAAILIRETTGLAIPTDPDDAPEWITLPAALIMAKIASPRLSGASDSMLGLIDRDYARAMKYLGERKSVGTSTALEYAKRAPIAYGDLW